jgi:glycosyltransferase involved in cell wall biosynthesis
VGVILRAGTMKIFYDYTIFSAQHGGIARYFVELASQMEANDEVLVFAGLHVNHYLSRVSNVFGMRVPGIRRTGFIRRAVNELVQPLCIGRWSPDVIHRTYYDRNTYRRSRVPVVVTVYDMIHEKNTPTSPICALKRAAVAGADRIITISEYTKAELCERLPVDPAKVTAIHLASSFSDADGAGTGAPFSRPYILYVGTRGGYKNFDRLLCALSRSPRLTGHFSLVCCGGGPFSRDERTRISSLGLGAMVRHLPAEDDRLARLYRHARALVYPSLDEGFGLPPLEAMSMGCPVLCSQSGAIPEVVGAAGHYFNAADEESIRVCMETVLFDDSGLQELTSRGKQRSKAFSWQRCAEATRRVYRDVALN